MTLDEARQLRKELEAIDAVLGRLGFGLAGLAESLRRVSRLMDQVAAKANALPDEDCCRDLLRFLTAVSARMDEVRAKAEAGPPVKDRIEQPTVRRSL